jgi:transposase-like protein
MNRRIDPKKKAAAIADLLNGDQPAVVAAKYGFESATVRQWKARLVTPDVTTGVTKATEATVIRQPALEAQQLALGELVMQNLRAKLIATQKIADYATTPEWLDKQNAADVAALFECLDRSAIGILDRLAHRGVRDNDGDAG